MPLLQRKRYLNLNHAARYVPAPSGGSFSGAGDVVSGAYAWYGLRGYNAAYSTGSNPALILVDQAGANQVTINILANGRLDVASISAWVTANSVSTIKVKQMHDQTGNSRHLVQATLTNMPVLNLTGFGSLPAIVFTAASSHYLQTSGTFTLSQPLTLSTVFNATSSSTTRELGGFAFDVFLAPHFNFAANQLVMVAGSSFSHPAVATASDAAWHAALGIANTTSGAVVVDGAAVTGVNAGSNNVSSRAIFLGLGVISNYYDGSAAEFGVWNSAFNSTQYGDMNTNQHHATNGYNF